MKDEPAAAQPMRHKGTRGGSNWRFLFRSDSTALNLVATVAGPNYRPFGAERLTEPGLLERWLREAQLPQPSQALSDGDLERTIELREAIYRLAESRVSGTEVTADDIELINATARTAAPTPLLGADARSAGFVDTQSIGTILGVIARDAIGVFSGPYRDRIKQCASPNCPIYFVDRSRNGTRRWCAMSPCGNQASAKAYRRREKAAGTE